MDAVVLERADELAELEPEWDRLAERVSRPFCSPAWLLAWRRQAAAPDAQLRVVAVRDGTELVAVAPFVVHPGLAGLAEYRLLGAGVAHRLAVVAERGREPDVAAALATALSGARPAPTSVRIEAVDANSSWPKLLRDRWPDRIRPWLRTDGVLSAPVVTLEGRTHDEWLGTKTKNFRDQLRRGRRNLDRRGATVRMAQSVAEAERDLRELVRLHYGRWEARGGSSALDSGIEAMLVDAAQTLVPLERLRVWTVELEGRAIACQLCLSAGGETAYWNGGFDTAASDLKPGFLALSAAIEDSFRRGERRFDLGGGAQAYKLRFADADAPIAWLTLFPRTARYPLTRLQMLRRHARERARAAAQRLSPETRSRLKRMLPPPLRRP